MDRPPYYLGFTTLNSETSIAKLPVRGVIPQWLSGALVRTGPARFEVVLTKYNHWFDGLAMLHRFAFDSGRVSYANRYLRSRAYEEAIAKNTITRGEFATNPRQTFFQRIASWFSPKITDNGCVNIAELGVALVALTETRLPVRFDPGSLATIGTREYDPKIKGPVATAHPHFDHARSCHYNYMVEFGRRSNYQIFRIDKNTGRQSVVATIPVDRPSYMHSFGMTERYLILAEFPLVVNSLRLLLSGKPFIRNYEWEPDRGVRFHIVDKESGKLTRAVHGTAFFAFHHVNAFEEGKDIFVDIVVHPDSTVIDRLYLDRLRSAETIPTTGRLTRFRIREDKDIVGEQLSDCPIELPRFDYRHRVGQRYRYVYAAGSDAPGDFLDNLVKLDLERNTAAPWSEEGCYPGEPVFVPAPETANEDDGVILSVVLDTGKAASFLLILDASTFSELARADLPHHIPFGFHGNYLPERHEPLMVGDAQ
ncbi:MAG: carotenoid oxygenase family protein [Desulfomonilaceae bacterium]